MNVLKEAGKRGLVPFSVLENPSSFMLAQAAGWAQRTAHLVCEHAGYKGAYATYSGAPIAESPEYGYSASAEILCPTNATNITDCWHGNQTDMIGGEDVVKVVCCSGKNSMFVLLGCCA